MRRWLILLLLALVSTTGCAAAGGMGAPMGALGGGGSSRRKVEPPPLPQAKLAGNAVATLLADGGEILPKLLETIKQAKKQVDVEMYEFGDVRLSDALLAAAKKGVAVRVILDATEVQSQAMARELQGKIPVRFYPVSGGIDHVKLLVADNTAVIGGMNWGKGSMLNHDYDILIQNAPGEFRALFERDWAVAGGSIPTGPAGEYLIYDAGIRTALSGHFTQMTRSVWVEMDELGDPEIIAQLREAQGRGLDVRVLLDPTVAANQASAAQLLQGNVPVRWHYMDIGRLHAKALIFDGQHMFVGSANLTRRGLNINHEAGVDLHAAELVGRLRDIFEADWQRGIPVRPAA